MTAQDAVRAERLWTFAFDEMLPAWRRHGWDPDGGGFHERLDAQFRPLQVPRRRLHALCRMVFCYSLSATLRPSGPALPRCRSRRLDGDRRHRRQR
jgi:mannose/cellobiose epimerase-like protein (N-acyl-D-glucosamine 2-epimerase family)